MATNDNNNADAVAAAKPHQLAPALDYHAQQPGPAAGQIDARQDVEKPAPVDDTDEDERNDDIAPLTRRDTNAMIADNDRDEILRIASQISRRRSSVASLPQVPSHGAVGLDSDDPRLDPQSDSFDLGKWVRSFVGQVRRENRAGPNTGVSWRNLDVFGSGDAIQIQKTVGSLLMAPLRLGEFFSFGKKEHKQILHGFHGILKPGELLVVLGRPGSGCSTMLKSICGELYGLELGAGTEIHYNGIPQKQMMAEFKGETSYNQEVDKHFPNLTVGQTLEFAATVRTPQERIQGMSRVEYARYMAKVVMAAFGLSHTYNTKVGDDYIRGVSGGERKRVSIAEMLLAGSPISAWDNSTRGLDSATAFKFVQSLRMVTEIGDGVCAVAIYQASQAIYDLFDKATVLYEGRQIYFGPADQARRYFEAQGWFCPARQTTGDFLTSITNPGERRTRDGFEGKVPRTPEDFERAWRQSPEYRALLAEIDAHDKEFSGPNQESSVAQLRERKNAMQARHVRPKSPYLISTWMQIKANTKRAYQRIWGDISALAAQVASNVFIALIVGSAFYGNPDTTDGFFARGSVLFIAILMNALTAISEINSLYSQRPIVEKQASYAFYHPATEAMAGILSDIPIKFVTAVVFNIILYFMSGLRREPGQFFLFFLITFIITFVMSAVFRTLAASTKTVSQAMGLSGVMVLILVIYTGFVIPQPAMHPWFAWLRWINPIFYAFEILVANEFHGQNFACGPSSFVPPYQPHVGTSFVCAVTGAVKGSETVSGDAFIAGSYQYYYSHVWRNFGILIAFLIAFMIMYFIVTELNSSTTSTAEALVFQRGHVPDYLLKGGQKPVETEKEKGEKADEVPLPPQTDVFTWRDVVYDIPYKGGERRLLDHVSGWVKPGTLTALMGVSGAGKTTLLDVLAQRTTMGVITGDMLVSGTPLDASFQRNTGYVQQQDLHLETATVRESLRFSAMLRQPKTVSKEEKYAFVEEVIKMLNMEEFANAVVGVPGEGLNVEQRKLLTIGVELAAKPKLLLFLDEPTSGLDSQSSWSICAFLRKLADSGQAILCTVHQPSAILFQEFDRLLFLAKGGKTVYFGQIGDNSRTLLDYFEAHGARKCDDEENPAEYMLEVVNNGYNDKGKDWQSVWNESQESVAVQTELGRIQSVARPSESSPDAAQRTEFAMPLTTQLREVTYRVFQQYWRMPSYIIAKVALSVAAGLFIGFTFFDAKSSLGGMQIVMFSVFMITNIFPTLVQQIQPLFITQRSLYEVRERPSKAYSWTAFVLANIVVEIPYQIVAAILIWACFYYPVVGIQTSDRQGLVLLFVIQLFLYASSFAHMTIVAMPDAQTASSIVTVLVLMSILFNGVLQSPNALPGFWIFMYRASPFTYWIAGIVSTMLHGREVVCAESETQIFDTQNGETCGAYLAPLAGQLAGTLQNPEATSDCRYCSYRVADQFLAGSRIYWGERWRNFGIMWVYIVFNIAMAILFYYMFRVRKGGFGLGNLFARKKAAKPEKEAAVTEKAANNSSDASTPTTNTI
ncbi:ABC multidrug transporter, putative [Cordyceps militaris CM01]|uniref:ABC multidrug transporter, putative n=1 Tax=Cordyceps militaris (strain CM01) TaxID=983644 RepID=G3J6K9_CORMM|nr:ABC multidrug transporter, putative [Cordyceps militaris CM01]EGX97037.1 ABC multidrug transporter, putative [Cordyceps militaris CM01]